MRVAILATEEELRSVIVRSLCRWWRDKSAGDIPDRADLDPADLKRLPPNLFIADVEQAPFRIRYRLMGTRAIEATGMDLTGRYMDELLPADHHEPWMEYYHRASQTRCPLFGACEVPTTSAAASPTSSGCSPCAKDESPDADRRSAGARRLRILGLAGRGLIYSACYTIANCAASDGQLPEQD